LVDDERGRDGDDDEDRARGVQRDERPEFVEDPAERRARRRPESDSDARRARVVPVRGLRIHEHRHGEREGTDGRRPQNVRRRSATPNEPVAAGTTARRA